MERSYVHMYLYSCTELVLQTVVDSRDLLENYHRVVWMEPMVEI